jgi:hypothetical protein
MGERMKTVIAVLMTVLLSGLAYAQKPEQKALVKPIVDSKAANSAAMDLATAAFAAHGGDKFKAVKTMVIRGSVDLTASSFPQAIPSAFSMAFAGDKYRLELVNAIQSFKQSYDGEQTYTSVQLGFSLPPINRLGLPLLQRLGEAGFVVSALPETAKNRQGFRITAADGFFTDFFVDQKTKQIKSYEASYEYNGRTYTTAVDIGKYREVDGVFVPERYSQRFDLGQIVVYGDFKSKEILLNTELAADVFSSAK